MTLILTVQYFDTLREWVIMAALTPPMPHSSGAIQDLKRQIQQAILIKIKGWLLSVHFNKRHSIKESIIETKPADSVSFMRKVEA